jgi:hypothetical protein
LADVFLRVRLEDPRDIRCGSFFVRSIFIVSPGSCYAI